MRASAVATLLSLGSVAYGASTINKKCVGTLCYSVNIPDSTAQSNSGDIFFQVTGPASYQWIGLGTGSQMSGSTMFIIYQSSNGQNVTVSPRKGSGHNEPGFDSGAKVSLMDGSGISNGQMVANIRCQSCSTSTSSWVYAANSQGPLKSDSTSASISQHDGDKYGSLSLSLAQAKGGDDSNPFVASNGGSGGNTASAGSPAATAGSPTAAGTTKACTPTATSSSAGSRSTGFLPPWMGGNRPTGTVGGPGPFQTNYYKRDTNECGDTGTEGFNNNGANIQQMNNIKRMAHGILAGLAFAVFFPLGAISIRMFSFPGLLWFHAGIQIIANLMFIIAFALGVGMAKSFGEMNDYHPILGIVVFIFCLIQPVLGHLHHVGYNRTGGRTPVSHGHIWLGRILITLGMINGGLGFKLANNSKYGPVIYVVVAIIFYIAYIAAIIIGERRRAQKLSMPPKYEESPRVSAMPGSPRAYYAPAPGQYELDQRVGGPRY